MDTMVIPIIMARGRTLVDCSLTTNIININYNTDYSGIKACNDNSSI